MDSCAAESRNPRRADCYDPELMLADLTTVRDRLRDLAAELPRRYLLRKSADLSQKLTSTRIFYGGRPFNAGAGRDHCGATWSADRGEFMARLTHLVYEPPDIELDFRQRTTFACNDCILVPDEAGRLIPQQGPPITLHNSSVSAHDFFRKPLNGMIDFAATAKAGGYAVFTNRS